MKNVLLLTVAVLTLGITLYLFSQRHAADTRSDAANPIDARVQATRKRLDAKVALATPTEATAVVDAVIATNTELSQLRERLKQAEAKQDELLLIESMQRESLERLLVEYGVKNPRHPLLAQAHATLNQTHVQLLHVTRAVSDAALALVAGIDAAHVAQSK